MTTAATKEPAPVSTDDHAPVEPAQPQRPRVLMLAHRLPYPPDRGDRIRSYHMLKLLSKHFDVAIAATSEENVWLQHHQLLSTIAKDVEVYPISPFVSKVRAGVALLTGKPITPTCFYRDGLAQKILQWHETRHFDAVLTFCSGMINYARLVTGHPQNAKQGQPRHVIDLVDVDSVKWQSYAQSTPFPKSLVYRAESKRLRKVESGKYDDFDAVTVVSTREHDVYREYVGEHDKLAVVGNGVDLNYFSPLPDRSDPTLLFVGVLDYKPNEDGVVWFANKVMPKLLEKVPDATFNIVGRNPTRRVEELDELPGVDVIGSVPDVRVYMEQAGVIVTPLMIARGVQNKVLEAMATEKPVVASSGAAAGVDAVDGEHFMVADEPWEWVEAITKLFDDAALRRTIGAAARRRVETHYNWDERLGPIVNMLKGEHDFTS